MVAPVLVWPAFDAAATAPDRRVPRRVARVRPNPAPGIDAFALTAAALGIQVPPEAALARLGEGEAEPDAAWFRAEPVMLVPDRDRLLLARLEDDALTEAEAQDLIAEANVHFGAGELHIERGPSGSWYVRAPRLPAESGMSPEAVDRIGIDAAMGAGQGGSERPRLLNELQMLWHAHPVNAARRAAGRMQANALWLWGGGALPPVPRPDRDVALIGSDTAVRGLATWLQLAWMPLRPPPAAGSGAGAVIVIGRGEAAAGAQWLDALVRRWQGFRLLGAAGDWRVPRRLLPRW